MVKIFGVVVRSVFCKTHLSSSFPGPLSCTVHIYGHLKFEFGIFNSMDGTEDEILWEETKDVPSTPVDDEDEDDNEWVYADHLTSEEWQNLVGDSDDEDFGSLE